LLAEPSSWLSLMLPLPLLSSPLLSESLSLLLPLLSLPSQLWSPVAASLFVGLLPVSLSSPWLLLSLLLLLSMPRFSPCSLLPRSVCPLSMSP